MRFKVIGIEPVNYTSRRTGQPVRGTNLHCINLEAGDQIQGQAVERLYVKEIIDCSSLELDDTINVYYNRYGSVDDIHLA